MRKILFSVSCGLFSTFTILSVCASEGDGPRGAFNPPKIIDSAQLEQQRLTDEQMQKTLEKQKQFEQRMQQVAVEVNSAISKCNESYNVQKTKAYTQLVTCYNPAVMAIYQRADYPYMDLMQSLNDKRLELGQGIDNNLITEAQAEAELSQFYDGIKEEERKRNNELTKYAQVSSNN